MPEKDLTPEQLELARKVRAGFLLAQLPTRGEDGKPEKVGDFTREGLWAMKSDGGAEAAAECNIGRDNVVRILFPPPDKGETDGRINASDEELLAILHGEGMTDERRAGWVESGRIPPAPVAPPAADGSPGDMLVVTQAFKISYNGSVVVEYTPGDKIPLENFDAVMEGRDALIKYARQHCR